MKIELTREEKVGQCCGYNSRIQHNKRTNPYDIYQGKFAIKEIGLNFDYRVSAMCKFGCEKFNKKVTCPPNIPEIEYFQNVLSEYRHIYILARQYPYNDGFFQTHWRTHSTNEIHELVLNKEKALFSEGWVYAKAFIGGSCKICSSDNCGSARCRVPGKGRIPLEATGLNIFSLMTSIGLEYEEPPIHYFWRLGSIFF
jgi:predicted metal-binding protein